MRARLWHLWMTLSSSYWFVPLGMTLLAAAGAWQTVRVDREGHPDGLLLRLSYSGGIEGARQVLSTLASSSITVAGVVFSITIATLSQASTQFGPRILRNFMRDTANQMVLGTFTATFAFCTLVLRWVGDSQPDGRFSPRLSVTCAVLLGLASICVLIAFIHHVSLSLQAPQVVANVRRDFERALKHRFAARLGRDGPEPPGGAEALERMLLAHGRVIHSARPGYLQSIDEAGLVNLARTEDLVIWLRCRPGDFLATQASLMLVHPPERANDRMVKQLRGLFIMGFERTPEQDVEYSINQMVELAVRALSPGINDPFTALTCVDWLGEALREIAASNHTTPYRYDQDGRLRMVAKLSTFEGVVATAFNQIRQNLGGHVAVAIRIFEVIAVLAPRLTEEDLRRPLREQVEMVLGHTVGRAATEQDRQVLRTRHDLALAALAGDQRAALLGPKGHEGGGAPPRS